MLRLLLMLSGLFLFTAQAKPFNENGSLAPHQYRFNKTDIALKNPERIAYWLEKRQKLSKSATEQQRQQAISAYINKSSRYQNQLPKKLSAKIITIDRLAEMSKKSRIRKTLKKSKPETSRVNRITSNMSTEQQTLTLPALLQSPQGKESSVLIDSGNSSSAHISALLNTGLEKAVENINTTEVKVLTVLIDFPDLPFDDNTLSRFDTDMYYENYTPAHYTDLLFSTTGYIGPSGQNLPSVFQFYQQESGQSFHFDGQVYGWVTASNNADYYGENSITGDDENVGELVIEAITKAVEEKSINLADYDKTDLDDFDNDGITDEPNGIVDHVMIIHANIGEEAGGGMLGEDAIWSHRYFVFDAVFEQPILIPGENTRIFGYTILPIDASMGVVAHEFGHDLGVRDEYDLNNSPVSAPVSLWSVMGSGAWLTSGINPAGSSPSSFSPIAADFFQSRFDGNWLNQLEIDYRQDLLETVNLVPYTNKIDGINQVKALLPAQTEDFAAPISGLYQFYSGEHHNSATSLSFNSTLAAGSNTLTMKARWQIEQDYDYVQVKVDGVAIEGNVTQLFNSQYRQLRHYISGNSIDINGAETEFGWVDLSFDLSSYAGNNVEVTIEYITDEFEGGYGFVVDDIAIIDSTNSTTYAHGAETESNITLSGFSRITDIIEGKSHNYYIHLRDFSGTNSPLITTHSYEPGVLMWYSNQAYNDNNVSEHPGFGFIGVVDADQNAISRFNNIRDTNQQLRDATFSLYNQSSYSGDAHLNNNATFNDLHDYSTSFQPESGLELPKLGFTSEVVTQSSNSNSASIQLSVSDAAHIDSQTEELAVTVAIMGGNIEDIESGQWNMGDGNEITFAQVGSFFTHVYETAGTYTITATYSSEQSIKVLTTTVKVAPAVTGNINLITNGLSVNYSATLTEGLGELTYKWDLGDSSALVTNSSGVHTFNTVGNFLITLTVSDDTGQSYAFTELVSLVESQEVELKVVITNDDEVDTTSSSTSNSSGGATSILLLYTFLVILFRQTNIAKRELVLLKLLTSRV